MNDSSRIGSTPYIIIIFIIFIYVYDDSILVLILILCIMTTGVERRIAEEWLKRENPKV